MSNESASALVAEMQHSGITLWLDGETLRYRAPRGSMTSNRRNTLAQNKKAIINLLKKRSQPLMRAHPDERHAAFPLTDIQASYLVGRNEAMEYGGVGCHGYLELDFPHLEASRLEQAWNQLIARHDMLRASFDVAGWQKVEPTRPHVTIEEHDMRDLPAHEANIRLLETREELSHKVYDATSWPLFEIQLSQLPRSTRIHVSVDLLITDNRSLNVIMEELLTLYKEPQHPLPDLDATFRDYVLALREIERPDHPWADSLAADRDYWLQRVDALPEAPETPLTPAGNTRAPRFRRHLLRLEKDAWKRLERGAADHGVTPTSVVLASYAQALSTWSRRPHFTLNVTTSAPLELHPDLGSVVGDFTSVIPLEVDTSVTEDVLVLAEQVQSQMWEDLDHRLMSGVAVLRELAHRRGRRSAAMPFVFTSTLGTGSTGALAEGRVISGLSQTPQVLIDCQLRETGEGVEVCWDTREGAFENNWDVHAFKRFRSTLDALSGQAPPSSQNDPVPSSSAVPPVPVRLESLVATQAERHPDSPALVCGGQRWTYRTLLEVSDRIAAHLQLRGIAPGSRVAICLSKGFDLVASILGVLRAGLAYVPIDVSSPPARRRRLAHAAGASLVIAHSQESRDDWGLPLLVPDMLEPSAACRPARHSQDSSQAAYIIFTSGSTGEPKGVVVSHAAAANTVTDVSTRFDIGTKDTGILLASPAFDLSVFDIFGILGTGGTLVVPAPEEDKDPSAWSRLVREHSVTVWNSVPAHMQLAVDAAGNDAPLSSLRTVLLSGDWIPVTLPGRIRSSSPKARLISLGGATEASIWSVLYEIRDVDPGWKSIPYGTSLRHQGAHVLDSHLRERVPGVPGELYISGAGLAQGYLGDTSSTENSFITHPRTGERLYRTGDWAKYQSDGTIELLGREDGQVKIRGHRIELGEIEAALVARPDISSAAALVDNRNDARRLVAFVVPERLSQQELWQSPLQSSPLLDSVDHSDLCRLSALMDQRCLHAMASVLWHKRLAQGPTSPEELMTLAAPQNQRLLARWIRSLRVEGVLTEQDGLLSIPREPTQAQAKQLDAEIALLEDRLHYGQGAQQYIYSCIAHLPELLHGDIKALDTLFPQGSADVAIDAYRNNLVGQYFNDLVARTVASLGEHASQGGPLRVLEVGAGVGGTTTAVLNALEHHDTCYFFTDISKYFLNRARETYASQGADMRFEILNINRPLSEQEVPAGAFDVVVAANVMHNAIDIRSSLDTLHQLLAPQGRVVILDADRETYPTMVSMSFQSGLSQSFRDHRAEDSEIFIARDKWLSLLDGHGFTLEHVYPPDGTVQAASGQVLIVARAKASLKRVSPTEVIDSLRLEIPSYMVPSDVHVTDRLPVTANGKVDRNALLQQVQAGARFSTREAAPGMTAAEQKVAELWQELLDCPPPRRDDSFFDVGGDSLVVSQMVSRLVNGGLLRPGLSWDTAMQRVLSDPTVSGVAALVDVPEEVPPSTPSAEGHGRPGLLLLNRSRDDVARVILHDGTGTIAPYRDLVAELSQRGRRRLIALELADLSGYTQASPAGLIPRICDEHLATLSSLHLREIHLTGYCMGGLLAAELANRIPETGARVGSLTVISSSNLPYRVTSSLVAEYAFARAAGLEPTTLGYPVPEDMNRALDAVLRMTPGLVSDYSLEHPEANTPHEDAAPWLRALTKLHEKGFKNRFDAIRHALNDREGPSLLRSFNVFFQSMRAVSSGDVPPVDSDLVFLRQHGEVSLLPNLAKDMTTFWSERCRGSFRVIDIPGDHFTCMQHPNVSAIADYLLKEDAK